MTAIMAASLALTSCSVVLNFDECQSTDQCRTRLGAGWTCSDDRICIQSGGETPLSCEDDAACVAELGPGSTCNSLGECQAPSSLLGPPCEQSVGSINDAEAFNMGVLLPLSGPEEGFGRPLLDAILLAQKDFQGINGVGGRPVGLIICDTQGNDELALSGARHLVNQAGVQAIIGPDYSSQTIDVATQVTIENEVLLISPSATATTVTNLDDNGLVWRTTPSDAVQGQGLGLIMRYILDEVVKTPDDQTKLVVLSRRDDTYVSGLASALNEHIPQDILSGDIHRFSPRTYPNVSAGEGADYSGVISQIGAEEVEPDLVVVLGRADAWEIAELLDGVLSEKAPIYLFVDAAKNNTQAQAAPVNLQGRIWGTAPQNVGESNYAPYLSFRIKFRGEYDVEPNDFQFVANAFDAFYVVALAASAEGFTGPELAVGMTRLSSGTRIHPNQAEAQQGMQILSTGGTIDYQGASGPLDFDENGDPQAGPITLWCLQGATLPEVGVILDGNLLFTPHRCDGENNDNGGEPDAGFNEPDAGFDDDAS
ncbi:MAG: ABC transporter substrate-binding protein [Bradymonadaceae bacterium]